jgi:hypothetical protein
LSKGYKLSAREKGLLVFLFVFVTGFLFVWYLFLPMQDAHDRALIELDALRSRQLNVMTQEAAIPRLRGSIGHMTSDIEMYREKYAVYTFPEQLEADFTTFLLKNGITPERVTLQFNEAVGNTIKFTVTVSANSMFINNQLLLADYTNEIYSYRLTRMRLNESGGNTAGEFTVEAVLIKE